MHDLHIIRDGHPFTPLELVMKLGRPSAAAIISEQIEALIATLDQIDDDPDVELNGDELDGIGTAEDEFISHSLYWPMPGCPISDPGEEDDHSGGDPLDLGEAEAGQLMPLYGIAQDAGPINFRSALDAHLAGGRA